MDKNNHYGNAMTKPLTCGCIKNKKSKIKNLSHKDKIGHLFIVDIKFNRKLADEKVLLFNEICTPLFKKKS